MILQLTENPSQKLGNWFTKNFSVNHFPKHEFCSLSLCALFLCSLYLCRPRSGPDEAVDEVDELVVEGDAVGLELGSECSAIEAAPDPDQTRQLMMSS